MKNICALTPVFGSFGLKTALHLSKLQDITRDDVIQFARDNGIRRPDAIIRDVVDSLKQFRTIATKYGVSEGLKKAPRCQKQQGAFYARPYRLFFTTTFLPLTICNPLRALSIF